MKKISIVIPCYRSAESLPLLIEKIYKSLGESLLEVILVNDCSPDNTWEVITNLSKTYSFIKGLNLMKNFGQHSAVLCGFNYVNGDYIVTMDDDLQNPPEEIHKLTEVLDIDLKVDVVIGVPKISKKNGFRKLGSYLLNRLTSRILDKPVDLRMTSFRAIRKVVVDQIKINKSVNPAIGSLLLSHTRKIKNIEVKHEERVYGTTGYNLVKSVNLFLNNVLNYSTLPLRMVSNIGILTSLISFTLGLFYFIKYIFGAISIPGWTTLILIMLFFFGIILISLGIIGEYLVRIISEVNHTPQYVIQETIGLDAK